MSKMVRSGPFPLALGFAVALGALVGTPAVRAQEAEKPKEDPYSVEILLKVPMQGLEISVEELLRDAGERLKKVVVIDEALRGKKIKFYTAGEYNFNIVRNILATFGVEIVVEVVDGRELLKTYLQRNLPQMGIPVATPFFLEGESLPGTNQIVTAVYQVKNADANGVQTAIRALMTRDPRRVGNIIYVQRSESVIVTDLKDAVEFYLKICKALDVALPSFDYKIIQIQYALADELATIVNNLYRLLEAGSGGGAIPGQPGQPAPARPPGAPGAGGAAQAQVVADPRTNKVVILALPAEIERIERLVKEIDVRVDPPPRHFHVYKCINSYAIDLADRLNQLFGGAVTQTFGSQTRTRTPTPRTSTGAARTTGGTGRTIGRNNPPGLQPQVAQPQVARPGQATTPGAQFNPGEGQIETRIVPDEQTNSLLIQAGPDDYREILAILKELDRKRMRVLIETQVWEIAVSDDLFFALEFAQTDDAATQSNPTPLRGHTLSNFGLTAPSVDPADPSKISILPNLGAIPGIPSSLTSGGLIFALTHGGFDQIPLILQAIATESNANLLTTPFAATNDNETAIFTIGESRPFSIATSTSVSAFQGFDRAEAISSLQITPRISSGNNLTLNINLQIETFGVSLNPNAPPPSQSRSYEGTVTVPNRQYVVFGGLEQEAVRETRTKIPIIGDIPYLGYLFGKTSYGTTRTRIYVFVRPVIFTDDNFDAERRGSGFLHDAIRANSLIGPEKSIPVIPDEILDAEAPGVKAAIYGIFGDGGESVFPEHDKTRAFRANASK